MSSTKCILFLVIIQKRLFAWGDSSWKLCFGELKISGQLHNKVETSSCWMVSLRWMKESIHSLHFSISGVGFLEFDMVKVGSGPDSWIGCVSPGVIEKSMYQHSPLWSVSVPHGSFFHMVKGRKPVLFHYTSGSSGYLSSSCCSCRLIGDPISIQKEEWSSNKVSFLFHWSLDWSKEGGERQRSSMTLN